MNSTIPVVLERMVPQLLNWSRSRFLGANQPTYKHTPIDTNGSSQFVENLSRKSNMVCPAILNPDRLPNDSEHKVLNTNSGSSTVSVAHVRFILKRSCSMAMDTSAIDTVEVSAATRSSKKKSDDHRRGIGSCANTSGRPRVC